MTATNSNQRSPAPQAARSVRLALALIAGSRPAGGEGAVGAEVSVYAKPDR